MNSDDVFVGESVEDMYHGPGDEAIEGIDLLPSTVMEQIFKRLDTKDLLRCAVVNKNWHQIIFDACGIWKQRRKMLEAAYGYKLTKEFDAVDQSELVTDEQREEMKKTLIQSVIRTEKKLEKVDINFMNEAFSRVRKSIPNLNLNSIDVDFESGILSFSEKVQDADDEGDENVGLFVISLKDFNQIVHLPEIDGYLLKIHKSWALVSNRGSGVDVWNWETEKLILTLDDFRLRDVSKKMIGFGNHNNTWIKVFAFCGDDTAVDPEFVFPVHDPMVQSWSRVSHFGDRVAGIQQIALRDAFVRVFLLTTGDEIMSLSVSFPNPRNRPVFHHYWLRGQYLVRSVHSVRSVNSRLTFINDPFVCRPRRERFSSSASFEHRPFQRITGKADLAADLFSWEICEEEFLYMDPRQSGSMGVVAERQIYVEGPRSDLLIYSWPIVRAKDNLVLTEFNRDSATDYFQPLFTDNFLVIGFCQNINMMEKRDYYNIKTK